MSGNTPNMAKEQDAIVHRIMDSAEFLFAQNGFASTSVRDITSAAGCNVASINYYFGSKRDLYERVIDRYLENMRNTRVEAIERVMESDYSLRDLLEGFSRSFLLSLGVTGSKRSTMHLILREFLDPATDESLSERIIASIHEIRDMVISGIQRLYPDADEESLQFCFISLVGQLRHFSHILVERLSSCHTLPPTFNLDNVISHVVEYAHAGIIAVIKEGSLDA